MPSGSPLCHLPLCPTYSNDLTFNINKVTVLEPDTILNMSHLLTHLILITNFRYRHYHSPQFTDVEQAQ